jgi:ParB/RepB/Spo0J family partition protein
VAVIAMLNQKGGVGKTTVSANLGGTWAKQGRRVLLVDNDPQGSLTQGLIGPEATAALPAAATIAAIYSGDAQDPRQAVRATEFPGLDLLAGSERAASYNNGDPHREPWERQTCLVEALGDLSPGYDVVIIDCPPNLNLCSWAALAAADGVLIPAQPEDYGSQGLPAVRRSIEAVRRTMNPRLRVLGLVVSMIQPRRAVHQLYLETLRAQYGDELLSAMIPEAADLVEATMLRKPVGGSNVAESTGAARSDGLPPGLDLSQAAGMPAKLVGLAKEKGAARIARDRIVRDETQPREEFDEEELGRLAASLKVHGQLQPIRVRWDEGRGVYVILMGERRWRAAGLVGLPEMSCIIHEGHLDDADRLGLQLVENALRVDLKPVEQARSYRRLMDAKGWSTREVADELKLSQSSIVRALTLLELPAGVQALVDRGDIAASVAAEVSKLDDPEIQEQVAEAASGGKMKRDEVADLVRAVKARRPAPAARPAPVELDLGDGMIVRLTWRKANGVGVVQAMRRALKAAQDRERAGEADAA